MSGVMGPSVWIVFAAIHFLEVVSVLSENSSFDERLYKLVNEIAGEYFQNFRCMTFAADAIDNVNYLEKRLPLFVINISELRGMKRGKLMAETFEQGCGGYIIQTRPERRLSVVQMLLDAKNETVSHRYNTQKYLFLPVAANDTDMTILFEPRLFFLPNFLFVSPEPSETFSLKTHSVFDPGNAERFEILDTWSTSKGYVRRNNLFPDKIKNINGRLLRFGVMNYVPYTVVIHDGNRTIFDGLEKRISAEFVKTINGTYEVFDHPVHLWGTKFPNGSGNGIFGSVQRGDADIGYAAFYQWYCDVLDCTFPYVLAQVSCLVPKPQVLTSWQTILLPFTLCTWVSLCVAYVVSSFFAFGLNLILNRSKGVQVSGNLFSTAFYSAYKLFRLQMQQTPRLAHESGPLATYMKISYLYYFLVALFWQGGIASILTIPRYEKAINTASDLVSRYPHLKWGANHDTWIHSIENSTEPVSHEVVKKFVTLPTETLIEKAKTRDFAFFIEKLHGGHFGFNEYINRETVPYLQTMKNYVYTAFTVLVLPRGSPYLEKLDNLIHWMFDTGITLKMETQVSLEVIDNHLQNMIRLSAEVKKGGKATLTVGHIKGPIYLYFAGILLSLATLIGERCVFFRASRTPHRKEKQKRRNKAPGPDPDNNVPTLNRMRAHGKRRSHSTIHARTGLNAPS